MFRFIIHLPQNFIEIRTCKKLLNTKKLKFTLHIDSWGANPLPQILG